uniref:Uncharacterized protein n=1 Tax=Nucleocytoviricota sp. TaxID=2809609 RepID=A0A9E8G4M7_9VIRU|nr:hypothetical protein [Nucleocytoviricota sp.]UZT29210.1 hypothetical protein [Nucleocytoviricota sp.]
MLTKIYIKKHFLKHYAVKSLFFGVLKPLFSKMDIFKMSKIKIFAQIFLKKK